MKIFKEGGKGVRGKEGGTFSESFSLPSPDFLYNANFSSSEGSGVTMMAGSIRSMRTVPGFAPRMGWTNLASAAMTSTCVSSLRQLLSTERMAASEMVREGISCAA